MTVLDLADSFKMMNRSEMGSLDGNPDSIKFDSKLKNIFIFCVATNREIFSESC